MGEYSLRLKNMALALLLAAILPVKWRSTISWCWWMPRLIHPSESRFSGNTEWDGKSDTLLPMTPCGDEELYSPRKRA